MFLVIGGHLAARVAARLAVFGLALVSGCEHKAPPPAPPPPKVSVVTVQAQEVPITTELPGRVAGYRYADVRPQVNGIILKRLFVEGSEVKAGQQLYQIDPAPYQATYDSAVAANASARALWERYKPLAEANAVSKQDFDNAEASHLQAQAAVETARINLIYTRVLSPIAGHISRSLITEGALVTANQATAIANVQQLDPVYVDVTQPITTLLRLKSEAAAGLLKQNEAGKAQVRLRLEDGTDYAHPGTLEFSEVTVDEGTGSVTLRALIPNPERLLLPGMFVREEIQEGVRQGAVLAPQQGVSHDQKGQPNALVVGPNNTVELRTIVTDRAIGDRWLVTSGLEPGDRIIVEGIQAAKPGSQVAPEEYRPTDEKTAQPVPATAQDTTK
ncbi:MAG TPA: efflux RND transporter periplasmic adaptor subunit [Steroidobacteraceae bacterium]|nr:efflux RND transporter periplasmic adaptor subunit [Steroidobacteraceae bacterium]